MKNKQTQPVHLRFEDIPSFDPWSVFDAGRFLLTKRKTDCIEMAENASFYHTSK